MYVLKQGNLYVGLCDCHKKMIRSQDEEILMNILGGSVVCTECNTEVKYKGLFNLQGNIIKDEKFKEIPMVVETKKSINVENKKQKERGKMTKERALSEKLIFEDGTPFYSGNKLPTIGALITAINLSVDDENEKLLNDIFVKYPEIIEEKVKKYFSKKVRDFLEK